ncbi:uncharacterized protein LOC109134751 [Beta vulgaris subsp. vulgaris]|nr:uncharacterized protein LOC109134751 [Beta vulgaris subsp. vulgaris]
MGKWEKANLEIPSFNTPLPKDCKLPVRSGKNLIWSPPNEDVLKVNFDGSKLDNGQAAYGFVIRNSNGEVLMARAKALGVYPSILMAEAMGLLEGIKGAISLQNWSRKIIFEGDNIAVINAMSPSATGPWTIANIILDAGALLGHFQEVKFQHCYREANRLADFMAHKGHSHPEVLCWLPPYCIDFSLLIRKDVLGWPPD